MTDVWAVQPSRLLGATADIVAAHVAVNEVAAAEMPALIASVHAALAGLGASAAAPAVPAPTPAVPVRASIKPDYLICLEDGKKFKTLKRHLMTRYGLTPGAYRAKWNLPSDYPMVAPAYAARRSALAKASGLGRKSANDADAAAAPRAGKAAARTAPNPEDGAALAGDKSPRRKLRLAISG